MPTKFPELFIDGLTLERETVIKFLDASDGKFILTQFRSRVLKALVYFIEQG